MVDTSTSEEEIIYAEIVHLPQSRIGNILHRSNYSDYEIPYLCKSSKENKYQIPVDDILVSIRSNQIILRSKRLNKQIIPRNTNAHNYSLNSLPIYEFLSNVQSEGHRSSIHFSLGDNSNVSYKPRIVYNNIILEKAKWFISREDLLDLRSKIKKSASIDQLIKWRENLFLPRFVLTGHSDNIIPINLDNINCLQLLTSNFKANSKMTLTEFIKPINMSGNSEQYTNEFIFTYKAI